MSIRLLSKLKNILPKNYSTLNVTIQNKKNIDSNDVKFEESIIVKQNFINEDEEKTILSEIGSI
jgi:DNA gyrase inhibitor GyrI